MLLLLPLFAVLSDAANIQLPGLTLPAGAAANKELVHQTFLKGYNAYRQFAFGQDDLTPKTPGATNPRNGWGATIFDAMPTLNIMGETTLYNEAVTFARQVDFSRSKTSDTVSFFETTIRYLGGMLSAYELTGRNDAALLAKAKQLGDKLSVGWAGRKVPVQFINFNTSTPQNVGGQNDLAAAASNILEFAKLAQYTGNQTYLQLADMTMRTIANNPNPVFPGLPPETVNGDGTGSGSTVSWDGGYDSYLEYLLKYGRLTNFKDPLWTNTWVNAVQSSITNLLKTTTAQNRTYLSSVTGGIHDYGMGDLACFAGGNWIMGGKLLNRDDIFQAGLRITDGCIATYQTGSGLGPGGWQYAPTDAGASIPASQQAFYAQHGFYITDASYDVRPEVFESAFYAWRATGDTKYQDFAASGIRAINNFLNSTAGFAPLNDVTQTRWSLNNQGNDLESFFFAEVMKYLYLMFDDPAHISLDEWVFNTESHPLLPNL
ncbi:seven-hairpin glycosidase [Auricularia subglabra TFB-10046 SS5]|nr:seven-hairpin glycosidase [Auricularia subglabra TFB-10046 SS5]